MQQSSYPCIRGSWQFICSQRNILLVQIVHKQIEFSHSKALEYGWDFGHNARLQLDWKFCLHIAIMFMFET